LSTPSNLWSEAAYLGATLLQERSHAVPVDLLIAIMARSS
jgi:hypothetical protein